MFEFGYNIREVNRYLVLRKQIDDLMNNETGLGRNRIWIEHYSNLKDKRHVDILSKLLVLIHPNYYFDRNGRNISTSLDPSHKRSSSFKNGINSLDTCQIERLIGISCPFNAMPRQRGTCQADHHWPFSEGGPDSLANRILLCDYHNKIKTSGIYFFNWKVYPEWLDQRLEQLYNLKS